MLLQGNERLQALFHRLALGLHARGLEPAYGSIVTVHGEILHNTSYDGRLEAGDLVLAEVLQGFRADRDFRQARTLMLHLDVRSVLSPALALRAAEHYRFLRRQGTTVRKTIDTVIATYCIDEDLPLLHDDKDFLPFEQHLGLRRAEIG